MKILVTGGLGEDSKILDQLKSSLKSTSHTIYHSKGSSNAPEGHEEGKTLYDKHLYIISPAMPGIKHIVQLVDDSNKHPEKTLYCFVEKQNGKHFSEHQVKSLKAIAQMVKRNGGAWMESLDEVAGYLKTKN